MTTDVAEQRGLGWLKEPRDERDYQLVQVHPELINGTFEISASSDLQHSPFMPPTENQLTIGSCGPFGSIANWRFALRRAGLVDFDGSELFQYVNARLQGGFPITKDTGTYIRDNFKVLADKGNAPEADWPYDVSKYTQTPPQKAYDDALAHQAIRYISVPNNDDAIDAVLSAGFPVCFGIALYQNWPMGNGISQIPNPQGQIIGGHCMNFVAHDRVRRKRKVRNQWGDQWGDGGYAEMSYEYCAQAQDLWYFEVVEGENVVPPPPPPPPSKVVDGIGVWTRNARTGVVTPNIRLWIPNDPDEIVGGIGVHFTDGSSQERWPTP